MKRLFFDIETSPNVVLSWGVGRKISIDYSNIIKERAIICVCWKWEGSSKVYSLEWDKGDDKKLLEDFIKVLNNADESIAHNGDRFDIKWLRTRCVFHQIEMPPKIKTLDTLKKARGAFYFNSNRLDYIGDYLGVGQKIETSYGLWKDIALNNCSKAMKKMVDYCKEDVRLLERVYKRLSPYITHNTHAAVLAGGEKWQCPECGTVDVVCNKTRTTAAGTIKREMKCNNTECRKHYTISNRDYLNLLEWRQEQKHKV